jgi:hypothetical protein
MHAETSAHIQVLREKQRETKDSRQPLPRALSAAIEALGSCDTIRSKLAMERAGHDETRSRLETMETKVVELEEELQSCLTAHDLERFTLRRELLQERERLAAIKVILAPVVRAYQDLCSDAPAPVLNGPPHFVIGGGAWPGDETTEPHGVNRDSSALL